MATDLRSLPAYFSTDADFRAWGSGINAQLAAVGLIQTADTGQINWTTALKPAGVGANVGYEIWRFNDTLQATKPIYMKIFYGSGGAADRPGLRTFIGTGSNGIGNMTGQISPSRDLSAFSSKTAGATLPSYCSGANNRVALVNNYESSNTAIGMLIERPKDSDGADTDAGIVSYQFAGSSNHYQIIPFTGALPTTATMNSALAVNQGAFSVAGLDVAVSPTVAFVGKPLFVYWCAYLPADIGALTSFTVEYLGDPHTLMPLGAVSSGAATSSSHGLAIPWE